MSERRRVALCMFLISTGSLICVLTDTAAGMPVIAAGAVVAVMAKEPGGRPKESRWRKW